MLPKCSKCKHLEHNRGETVFTLSPLCAGPISDDKEVMGSGTSSACAGIGREVKEIDEGAAGGPQTLSVYLVPGLRSTSP